MTSFKRTQRKYVQKAYRVRNWREYETGLRARGESGPSGSDLPWCTTPLRAESLP